jgi:hypothetical protein
VDFQKVIGDRKVKKLIGDRCCEFPERRLSAISVVEFQKVIGDRKAKELIGDRCCGISEGYRRSLL